MIAAFDPIWENEIYGRGQALNRYPFDSVVTFVFRHAPRHKPRAAVRVLEIGCGAGNNIWFLAREGFQAYGIDGSATAIAHARDRLAYERLAADLRVGDFTELPYDDSLFDLVIDRGALVCVGRSAAARAVAEVARVLAPGGRFFCNPYSSAHTSHRTGLPGPDGLTTGIQSGTVTGVGDLCFYDREAVDALLAGWSLISCEHVGIAIEDSRGAHVHAEWRVIAVRPEGS